MLSEQHKYFIFESIAIELFTVSLSFTSTKIEKIYYLAIEKAIELPIQSKKYQINILIIAPWP